MDNKRLLLATAICFGLLIGWQYLAQYMGWLPEPVPVEQTATDGASSAVPGNSPSPAGSDLAADVPAPAPRFVPSEGREVKVETPLYTAVFHSAGGILQSFELKKYAAHIGPDSPRLNMVSAKAASLSPLGLLLNGQPTWSAGQWAFDGGDLSLAAGQSGTLTFTGDMQGIRITRTITFHADTYLMEDKAALATEGTPTLVRLSRTLAVTPFSTDSGQDTMSAAWDMEGSFKTETSDKKLRNEGIMKSGDVYWAGLMSNYFLAAVIQPQGTRETFKARIVDDNVWRAAVDGEDLSLAQGAPAESSASWWLGPKERDLLKAAPNDLDASVDLGWTTILAIPILWLLNIMHSLVSNWGVAIILLTVLIKLLFWPLMRKSYKSMEKMKKIQPMMAELQKKHGKDKEALSRETMQLYKTYGVNPMSGCLPMLVQLPVFIALYQALLHSIELRHASFIPYLPFTDITWLADLSVRDPFYITPLIMGATMFLQQWMSPAAGDPTQRKMMMLMPVIFTVMCINFPSGLVVYWLCSNVLSIVQQWWTLRKA